MDGQWYSGLVSVSPVTPKRQKTRERLDPLTFLRCRYHPPYSTTRPKNYLKTFPFVSSTGKITQLFDPGMWVVKHVTLKFFHLSVVKDLEFHIELTVFCLVKVYSTLPLPSIKWIWYNLEYSRRIKRIRSTFFQYCLYVYTISFYKIYPFPLFPSFLLPFLFFLRRPYCFTWVKPSFVSGSFSSSKGCSQFLFALF